MYSSFQAVGFLVRQVNNALDAGVMKNLPGAAAKDVGFRGGRSAASRRSESAVALTLRCQGFAE